MKWIYVLNGTLKIAIIYLNMTYLIFLKSYIKLYLLILTGFFITSFSFLKSDIRKMQQ